MKRLEKYRDIFKYFSIPDLEKTERVLNAVQESQENHPNESLIGFRISDLNCQMNDIRKALPVLESIKNNLFPAEKPFGDSDEVKGLMRIYMPTQEVTISKDKRLTGLYVGNLIENTLQEIQLYLSKNKSKNPNGGRISLVLSKIGLKNEINSQDYAIKGKRFSYIEILNENSPLLGRELAEKTGQASEDVSDGIAEINRLSKKKLGLSENIIVSGNGGYLLNPLYKIKILL